MPNQAGVICNTPIHNDVAIATSTTKLYVNQGIYYANEGQVSAANNPPPLTWANRIGATQNYRSVMAFCRTGIFVIGVTTDDDFWPQFYRPHFSNRLT